MTETEYASLPQRPEGAEVAVVILNWNGRKLLEEFLPSVVATTGSPGCIGVADNGSTDGSLDWLDENYPEVYKLRFSQNYGFAGGYNKVVKISKVAGFKYVVMLNSDVETTPGWLDRMYDYMESHPDVAACQPKIRSYRQKDMFEYAGASGGFIDRNGYPYCRGRIFDTCERDNGQYDDVAYVDWASGAALMVRSDVYMAAGGLDASFFAHMEEIDLCWRIRLMGYKIAVVPSSVVYHLGGGSLPPSDPRKTYLNFRNNLLMLHKNLPCNSRGRKLIWRRLLDAVAWARYVVTGNWQSAKAILKAHGDYRRMAKDIAGRGAEICDADKTMRPNILVEYYLKGHKRYADVAPSR